MNEDIYRGEFYEWLDVAKKFTDYNWGLSNEERDKVCLENIPEPEQVIFAEYDLDGYEGSALVVYYNKGLFYINEGGHCSCYGLEGQWSPESYEPNIILEVLDRRIKGALLGSDINQWKLIKERVQKVISERGL